MSAERECAEMKTEMAEMRAEMAGVAAEMAQEMANVKSQATEEHSGAMLAELLALKRTVESVSGRLVRFITRNETFTSTGPSRQQGPHRGQPR